VKATSVADPTKSATATVTLAPLVTISLTPSSVSLLPSQDQTFTPTVSGTSSAGVTWSLNPALGSLASSATTAVYVAPSTAPITQSVTITGTSMADPSKAATAVITLLQAVTVSLSPSTVSLAPSGTQQFTAAVLGTGNNAVTWSINPAVGTISPAGLYTAPSNILTSQSVTVTAQSVADPTKSASATISLSPPTVTFTYYVDSANGSDSNPGTLAKPWKTIAKVNSTTLTPGQSVGFARGGVWRETLQPGQSGTVASPITFGAYGSGAQPIIDGLNVVTSGWTSETKAYYSSFAANPQQVFEDGARLVAVSSKSMMKLGTFWFDSTDSRLYVRMSGDDSPSHHAVEVGARNYAVLLDGRSYIRLDGITLHGASIGGLNLWNDDSGLLVNGCTFEWNYDAGLLYNDARATTDNVIGVTVQNSIFRYNGGSGIEVAINKSNGWKITSNQIYSNDELLVDASGATFNTGEDQYWNGGIKVQSSYQSGEANVIASNLVYNNGVTGTTPSQGMGIWTDNVSGWSVERNVVFGNQGPGIFLEKTINGAAVYNVVYGNTLNTYGSQAGIEVYASEGLNSSGNLIANNTVYGNWWGIACGNGTNGPVDTSQTINNIFRNNLVTGSTHYNLYAAHGGDNDGTQGSGNVYEYNGFGPAAAAFVYWGASISTHAALDAAYGSAMDNLVSDPLFTNASAGNFALQAGSPAIGAGVYIPGVSTANPPNIGAK
jgi:parallel beta-helix repeat protein